VIPHPLGGLDEPALAARAEAAWPRLREWVERTLAR
jgi:hypothetical protein